MDPHAVNRFAVEAPEMRAIAGDQGFAAMADRRGEHGPVLLRKRQRVFERGIGRVNRPGAQAREERV